MIFARDENIKEKGIDKSKIEERAIGILNDIINEHPTMESKIEHGDKYMSWDGSIIIYKPGCTKRTKETYDYAIPVQIKGRTDSVAKYLSETVITYPVDVRDLKLYYEQTGCLYFIVFFDGTTRQGEIFYSSLYPSKLKGYIERNNRGKKQISIKFLRMKKDAAVLYSILAQYGQEMVHQGYGRGQIVSKTISLDDLAKVEAISATVIGVNNELEFIKRMNSGDVCIYGKENGIDYPIESNETLKFFMGRDNIPLPIIVEDKEYYSKYNVIVDADECIVVKPSDNISISINIGKIDFRPRSSISHMKNDIEFLLALEKANTVYFGQNPIQFGDLVFPQDFREKLVYLRSLCYVLNEIGIEIHKTYTQLTESNSRELGILLNIKEGNLNHLFKQTSNVYNWRFDDKFYPILVEKQHQGNALFPLSNNSTLQLFKWDEGTNHYKFPTFAVLDIEVLARLYNFNYSWFEEQIDIADVNSDTMDDLNFAALKLISAYDLSLNAEFLELARRIYSKFDSEEMICLINTFQIKARETGLSNCDIMKLNSIDTTDVQVLFCKSVLLKNKKEADGYYMKMSKKEKDNIKELPIMKLYREL